MWGAARPSTSPPSSRRCRTAASASPCSTSPPPSRCPPTVRCGSCRTSCSPRTPRPSAPTNRAASPSSSPRTRGDCSTASRCSTSSTPASSTDRIRSAPREDPTVRTVISLVVALLASLFGTVLLWYGGGHAVFELGRFAAEGAGLFPLLVALGCLLLAGAAVTVRWSRAGVIAAGSVHVLFSLLGILVPFQPMDGISSPTTQLLGMLFDVDPALATGGYYFVAFGAGLLIGFALLGVGILARRGRPTVLARVLSAVGGLLALGACGWAFAAGGDFYRRTFQMLDWDAVTAVTLVVAALIFGALVALSGRSAIGGWIAGGVLSLVGVI